MKAEEYILRFLAFNFAYDKYEKPLAGFLNTFVEQNRNPSDAQLSKFQNALDRTSNGVRSIFGQLAFKVFDPNHSNRILSPFNAALFDAQMLAVARTGIDPSKITDANRKKVMHALSELLENDQFQKAITLATSDVAQIRNRVAMTQAIIAKHT
jgi:hypothetical protein